MRRSSFLGVTVCAMAMVLMAGRCSEDEAAKAPVAKSTEPAAATHDDAGSGRVDAGVEKDPLGETMGGQDDITQPLEDPSDLPPSGGDSMLDDTQLEPQPVPDSATDL